MLFPGAIKKRDHPMIENIKKSRKGAVFRSNPLKDELGITIRKNSHRPGQAHEVHQHLRRNVLRIFNLLNLACGESQGIVGAEMNRFVLGLGESAHGLALTVQALQQRDRLEKLERTGVLTQYLFEWRVFQTRILRPARGCHSCNISFLWGVVTTSWVKLFSDALSPRNRSTTAANR